MSESGVEITVTRSPDFKLVYANGVFGGLNPLEGRMIFYVDRIIPKVVEGQMKTASIEREMQVEVHMSPVQWVSMSSWMQSHIERMKKEGKLMLKEKGEAEL